MSDNRENKHNEEPHDSEEEKYSFLQETVKDEQRSKKRNHGKSVQTCRKRTDFLDLQQVLRFMPFAHGR